MIIEICVFIQTDYFSVVRIIDRNIMPTTKIKPSIYLCFISAQEAYFTS